MVTVAPMVFARGVVHRRGGDWALTVRGVTPAYFVARELGVSSGGKMTQ
jgi:hypothetical protein